MCTRTVRSAINNGYKNGKSIPKPRAATRKLRTQIVIAARIKKQLAAKSGTNTTWLQKRHTDFCGNGCNVYDKSKKRLREESPLKHDIRKKQKHLREGCEKRMQYDMAAEKNFTKCLQLKKLQHIYKKGKQNRLQ